MITKNLTWSNGNFRMLSMVCIPPRRSSRRKCFDSPTWGGLLRRQIRPQGRFSPGSARSRLRRREKPGHRLSLGRRECGAPSEHAAQLVSLKPDVIFAWAPQGAFAAKKATATIPIVFLGIGDPVGIGVVDSLARPGGNITGVANMNTDLSGKRLELLKESAPKITSVAVLWNSSSQGHRQILKEISKPSLQP